MSKAERNKLYRINNDTKHGHRGTSQAASQHTGSQHQHSHRQHSHRQHKSGMRRHLIEQQLLRECAR